MILYTDTNNKIHCIKVKSSVSYGDYLIGSIDDTNVRFAFSCRNNATNFYFIYDGQCYRTPQYTIELSLYDYLEKHRKLFTKSR